MYERRPALDMGKKHYKERRRRIGRETKPLFLGDIRYRLFSPSLLQIQQHLRVLQLRVLLGTYYPKEHPT